MASVLDFLFEGKPPPSVSSNVTTQTNLPDWYQDVLRGLITKSSSIAGEKYQGYTAPRVAPLTDMQNQAYGQIGDQLDNPVQDPAFQGAQAAFGEAGKQFPDEVGRYMSPYQSGVVDEIARLGTRNLTENILPKVTDDFISQGGFGGSRNADFLGRAVRDTQMDITGKQAQYLDEGYKTAGNLFNQDASRAATVGTGLSNLGTAQQGAVLKDAAAGEAAGQAQQLQTQKNLDVAHGDFVEQRDFGKGQADFLSNIIRGLPSNTSTSQTTSGPQAGLQYQPSPLAAIAGSSAGLAALLGLGKKKGGLIHLAKGGAVSEREQRYADGGSEGDLTDLVNLLKEAYNPRNLLKSGDAVSGGIGRKLMERRAPRTREQDQMSPHYKRGGRVRSTDLRVPPRGGLSYVAGA